MSEMTTISVPKKIINEYKILSVILNEQRNKLIENALQEFLDKNKK